MRYSFAPKVLLRMPVKSPADYNADRQTFLNDLFFRTALYLATPVFYATLERHRFQAEKLSDKEVTTLQKYINRYCFRPTPFGLFSSVTLADWLIDETSSDPAVMKAVISASMTAQNLINESILDAELRDSARFVANPSIYRLLNEYRFFRTGLDEQGRHRDYQLQSIAYSKILKDLITICQKGQSRTEIVNQIISSAMCTQAEAEDYTEFLIDSQLLVRTDRLNITGEDPLTRSIARLDAGTMKTTLVNLMRSLAAVNQTISLPILQNLENQLSTLLKDSPVSDKLNLILQRSPPASNLKIAYQDQLREGITALQLLNGNGQLATLSQFIKGFQQHFEGQTLPLLQALDPEAGVGYQHPETEKNNPLLETLNIPYKSASGQTGTWSPVHSVLMEAWLRQASDQTVIKLQESDLERLRSSDEPLSMLGMSVLFRVSEHKVFIENAGGINAPALLGRFTTADEQIAIAAKSMAGIIEAQNPEIIFAELLHLSDPHTDNVNRRAHIYRYELPVTAASTLPESQQIQLSDLYIRVVNSKVILFSDKHQKIIIPRLTSAYNHSLNKLPLFRFLADLPYQYGRSSLGLELRSMFPDLSFYARVEYKDTILSLATWIITEKQLNEMQSNDQDDNLTAFNKLSADIKLPRYFLLAEGDQELVFDGHSPPDISFFCNCIRQKKEAVLKEFLQQPVVQQYNTYLLPTAPVNMPSVTTNNSTKKVQRKYMPGSEWLYLKVYAPKIGVNRLLLRLGPLLNKRYGKHRISQWFFIRYEDQAPHIRVRLKVDPEAISEVLIAFKAKLEDRIQQQVIREFQIDVYTRELERYAVGGIELTEHFFWKSSQLVYDFVKLHQTSAHSNIHIFALYSTQAMIAAFIPVADEQIAFALTSFQQFLPEFTDKPFKVDLDKKYRELSPEIMAAFGRSDPALLSGSPNAGSKFLESLRTLNNKIGDEILKNEYLRSIIHMHLNRVFTDESRKQEMICYYLLHKYLLSVKGRNKRQDKPLSDLS